MSPLKSHIGLQLGGECRKLNPPSVSSMGQLCTFGQLPHSLRLHRFSQVEDMQSLTFSPPDLSDEDTASSSVNWKVPTTALTAFQL